MLLTAHGAARLLGTSERQIYRWVDDNEIPCRRVRDQLRFNPTDLLEWATTQRMAVHVEAFEDDDPADRPPSLAAALRQGRVLDGVAGADREAVLRAIVGELPLPDTFDRELLIEVMLAREASAVTPIGDGIAIPQVRNPIVAARAQPEITVCYLATPIAFGGADGTIRTIIVAVVPTVRTHLRMLARLARALADETFRAALDRRAARDELVGVAERIEAAPPVMEAE
ncbi:MAG TPA: PTS sugar transporter subunit IIA [Kofleriaceae bacterium]|nr:PTS sugar transporter subunit IIA [Kofleriaceae bacterium]